MATSRTASSGNCGPSGSRSARSRRTRCSLPSARRDGGRTVSTAEIAEALTNALVRLDGRLALALEAIRAATGRTPGADPFRGLYMDAGDAIGLLARGP